MSREFPMHKPGFIAVYLLTLMSALTCMLANFFSIALFHRDFSYSRQHYQQQLCATQGLLQYGISHITSPLPVKIICQPWPVGDCSSDDYYGIIRYEREHEDKIKIVATLMKGDGVVVALKIKVGYKNSVS